MPPPRLADEIGISVQRTDGSHIFVSIGLGHGDGVFSRRGFDRLGIFLPIVAALLRRHWGPRHPAATGRTRQAMPDFIGPSTRPCNATSSTA